MRLVSKVMTLLAASILFGALDTPIAYADEDTLFVPMLVYRTGPYAPSGIPIANGFRDYLTLINNRDGGINGVKVAFEECETQYDTKLGVACYEKLKDKGVAGAAMVNPYSTGITYQLIPRAPIDKIPVLSMGYGRTAAADGRVFKWVFNFPATYWSQASAFIRYIGQEAGGLENLRGKKLALLYHDSTYGKEPIATLEILARRYGFELNLLAVEHPGQDQTASWLEIGKYQPDWIFLWGWGEMNQVALREAASANFPMERLIGVWWSGSEADVLPVGEAAAGYKSGTFHGVGDQYPVHQDIVEHIYGGDYEEAKQNNMGQVLYNRGLANAMYGAEAIRTAMLKFGNRPLNGEEVRWGLENLRLTDDRLKEIGMLGFVQPLEITCADHESGGPVIIQQWSGTEWALVSGWIPPMPDVVRPLIERAAAQFATEHGITARTCG